MAARSLPQFWPPADDARCNAWGRETAARLAALSMAGNYVNEQSEVGTEMALGAYGEQKYRRLVALKTQFDPDNLFRLPEHRAGVYLSGLHEDSREFNLSRVESTRSPTFRNEYTSRDSS